jgi:hypothetical protein
MPDFKRQRHQLVHKVLAALNRELLSSTRCYFGGGTRIILELDEYRESLDVDFLCADKAGYRHLRSTITQQSLGSICSQKLELLRDVRADMYGIRTFFNIDETPIKFEIVNEGRIFLEGSSVEGLPVVSLDHRTCFAEKLLANADRVRDKSTLSRDLVDLAFMAASWSKDEFTRGLSLAEDAYGGIILKELSFALAQIREKTFRRRCIEDLNISDTRKLDRGLSKLKMFCEPLNGFSDPAG